MQDAKQMLERAVVTARACESGCLLIRPSTFIDVLRQTGGAVIQWWQPSPGQSFIPTYTCLDGGTWPIDITDRPYAHRQDKVLGGVTRGLRAVN